MNTTSLDFLFKVEPPWIHVGPGEVERVDWIPSFFYSHTRLNVCVRRFRGEKMRSVETLMNEFGAALQLFDGFGENWYALEDCLRCLDEWLPADAYVLVVERAEDVLRAAETGQLAAFLKTLELAGKTWSEPVEGSGRFGRPAIPFHVLLNISSDSPSSDDRIMEAASEAGAIVGFHRNP